MPVSVRTQACVCVEAASSPEGMSQKDSWTLRWFAGWPACFVRWVGVRLARWIGRKLANPERVHASWGSEGNQGKGASGRGKDTDTAPTRQSDVRRARLMLYRQLEAPYQIGPRQRVIVKSGARDTINKCSLNLTESFFLSSTMLQLRAKRSRPVLATLLDLAAREISRAAMGCAQCASRRTVGRSCDCRF